MFLTGSAAALPSAWPRSGDAYFVTFANSKSFQVGQAGQANAGPYRKTPAAWTTTGARASGWDGTRGALFQIPIALKRCTRFSVYIADWRKMTLPMSVQAFPQ